MASFSVSLSLSSPNNLVSLSGPELGVLGLHFFSFTQSDLRLFSLFWPGIEFLHRHFGLEAGKVSDFCLEKILKTLSTLFRTQLRLVVNLSWWVFFLLFFLAKTFGDAEKSCFHDCI